MTKTKVLAIAAVVAKRQKLTFDGEGTFNFKKVGDGYHVYFRSLKNSNRMLEEVWLATNKSKTKFVELIKQCGANRVVIKGGSADMCCSVNIYV